MNASSFHPLFAKNLLRFHSNRLQSEHEKPLVSRKVGITDPDEQITVRIPQNYSQNLYVAYNINNLSLV